MSKVKTTQKERAPLVETQGLEGVVPVDTQAPSKPAPFSDMDLNQWRSYSDIITDSLWLLGARDSSSVHSAEYWGNFVPQIAHQAILRFTKKGETVLDGFLGLGTALIECKRLGRHGVGVELVPDVAERAEEFIQQADNPYQVRTDVVTGDSRECSIAERLEQWLPNGAAQLLILHPPYHDIIKFSDLPADLSNLPSEGDFLREFGRVVDNLGPLLKEERHLVLVIGDYYSGGEWHPLGFHAMEEVLKRDFRLKSICVKDIQSNRGKRNQEKLWRYRSLKHGFYIFKHEYIMFFQKRSS